MYCAKEMKFRMYICCMNTFATAKPYYIAGPCSAESLLQLTDFIDQTKNMPLKMIRAGVWKPRSKPGNFEGHGEQALIWILELKKRVSIPFCIEVANKDQVELALKYNIDAVWLGARTTVNPFVVQEICDALRGTKIPVLVKNPINPDIELWCGAIERIQQCGTESIAAVHRGFSSYDKSSKYRNNPIWAIPIELKRRYPSLPILCDPSHITGNKSLIASVAQRALDLDFDGLMIESHPNPELAMSDAAQQITPSTLEKLLKELKIRSCNTDAITELENVRQVLDSLDAEIVALLGKRMSLVKELATIKSKNNMPIFQQERWREIIISRTEWGQHISLTNEFILKLFEIIHDESIKTQFRSLGQYFVHECKLRDS